MMTTQLTRQKKKCEDNLKNFISLCEATLKRGLSQSSSIVETITFAKCVGALRQNFFSFFSFFMWPYKNRNFKFV